MHRPVLAHYHLCHGANLTSVHGLSVKRRDGHDAARRAREKNLITVVRHVNGHNLTTDREPRILCNLKNALPSDALETAAIGCVDDAIIHQQYVEGGSLGEVAVPVGKHGVRRAAVLRLEHGSHKIPHCRLLAVGSMAPGGTRRTVLATIALPPVVCCMPCRMTQEYGLANMYKLLITVSEASCRVSTMPFVTIISARASRRPLLATISASNRFQFFARNGQSQSKPGTAGLESRDVVVEAEELPIPDRGCVIGLIAMQEPLVDERNSCFMKRYIFARDPSNTPRVWIGACRRIEFGKAIIVGPENGVQSDSVHVYPGILSSRGTLRAVNCEVRQEGGTAGSSGAVYLGPPLLVICGSTLHICLVAKPLISVHHAVHLHVAQFGDVKSLLGVGAP
ncbi:hypothetical protein ACCO45_012948 [Purpureocillium lilacinum]|uniref:Uncharacterized protein n=1 Tax=Purpureocillium lilacinum TaxID=33203 RepID=A0ACC4D9F8_PURLI